MHRTTDGESEPPRRIVVVHTSDERYGADRMLLIVLGVLEEFGDVEVWLPDDVEHGMFPLCEELTRRQVPWQHLPIPVLRRSYIRPGEILGLLRRVKSTRRLLRERPIDMVWCATSASLLTAPLARTAQVPSRVLHVQELWSGRERHVLRWLARATTARIAISNPVARATELLPPPVVVENCVERPSSIQFIRNSAPSPHYVVASRWNRWKGHATLINAWELAGCPGRLTVLGGPPPVGEGVDVEHLVRTVVTRPETIEIIGEVSDAMPFILAADALILPSDDPEPFGLVLIEAFALGKPAIASRAGGPVEIVSEGEDGWLYDIRNQRQLATLLTNLTLSDLRAAGTQAQRTYEKRFSPERYQANLRQFLRAQFDIAPH